MIPRPSYPTNHQARRESAMCDGRDTPTQEKAISTDAPVAKEHVASTPPPLLSSPTVEPSTETKPTEPGGEQLQPIDTATPVAKLPEPPQTSNDSQWQSGDSAAVDTRRRQRPPPRQLQRHNRSLKVSSAPIASRGVPEIYSDRLSADRGELVRRRGGSAESEAAVQAALEWLAANQSADGRWDADRFGAGHESAVLGQNRQGAGAKADTAMTGLALLAFLGAGNTHQHGQYAQNVRRGLEFLIASQGKDGNLAGEAETYAYMYCHGMATFALCEAYAMSGDQRLEAPAKAAINYTLGGQIKSTGGWRYRQIESPGEQGDTSQLGWQWMALKSAELAGIDVPPSARDGVARFLTQVSSGANGGKASYRPGERPTRTMTAEALVCRQFLACRARVPRQPKQRLSCRKNCPTRRRSILYYWYYGTLSMYQLQGPYWDRWNQAMQNTLVNKQRTDGDAAGSWDPECIWGGYGGRVYSTAMSALCLEVYYRYLPLYRSCADMHERIGCPSGAVTTRANAPISPGG